MNDDMSSELAVRFEGVTTVFGDVVAVNDLSFDVPAGVIAGFVGPNGSGKTTSMRILATLQKQDGGTARVLGLDTRVRANIRDVRRSIGFMPDYFGLYPDMTAGEYLELFAAAYHIPTGQRRQLVGDILDLVDLTGKQDTVIAGLSRGMQQKLSLGRCLVHDPSVLILDEPASGLDPRARIELLGSLRALREMGKTILISSHILGELQSLCDMFLIIDQGQLMFAGTLDEVSEHLVDGTRLLELSLGDGLAAGAEMLATLPGVGGIRRNGDRLCVTHDTGLRVSEIVRACIESGLHVEEVRRQQVNLDEAFMRLTQH